MVCACSGSISEQKRERRYFGFDISSLCLSSALIHISLRSSGIESVDMSETVCLYPSLVLVGENQPNGYGNIIHSFGDSGAFSIVGLLDIPCQNIPQPYSIQTSVSHNLQTVIRNAFFDQHRVCERSLKLVRNVMTRKIYIVYCYDAM